jgi:hypothetical protein
MPDSFIPEHQLAFSPALAATIGLEEAILLQHLGELFRHHRVENRDNFDWLTVERQWLLDTMPFWDVNDLQRISKSLVDKGVILLASPPLLEAERVIFAINKSSAPTRRTTRAGKATRSGNQPPGAASLLAAHWTPTEDLVQLLALNHNIPRQYALDQLEDFVYYWRERGEISHAWENKFRQHVLSRWRHQQQAEAERFSAPRDTPIDNSWYPSADALEIMLRSDVSQAFIDDAVPEFVLYWRERGESIKTLNSKFIQHIRRQWARYTSAMEHETEPQRIPENWQPKADVYDILHMSHIDTSYAQELLPEFTMYWRDTNQMQSSWSTKFLQHVKYKWARRHQLTSPADASHGKKQGSHSTGSTRSRSLEEDLNDRSWARRDV